MTSAIHLQAYNGQGSSTSERFSWLKAVYSAKYGAPTKTEERFLRPFV